MAEEKSIKTTGDESSQTGSTAGTPGVSSPSGASADVTNVADPSKPVATNESAFGAPPLATSTLPSSTGEAQTGATSEDTTRDEKLVDESEMKRETFFEREPLK